VSDPLSQPIYQQDERELHDRVLALERDATSVSIYRPIAAYCRLRELYRRRDELRPEVDRWLQSYARAVESLSFEKMGQVLVSTATMTVYSARTQRLRALWEDANRSLDQKGAFGLAILALYVSLASVVLTLLIGLPAYFMK
jgi:hypothetical protein